MWLLEWSEIIFLINSFCGVNDTLFWISGDFFAQLQSLGGSLSCVFHHWITEVTSECNTYRPLGGQQCSRGPYPHTFSSFVNRHCAVCWWNGKLFKHCIDYFSRQFVTPSAKHVCKINRSKYIQINTS